MAFVLKQLNSGGSPGGKGRSPVIYTYITADDTITQVKASGYFNGAAPRLVTGDIIIAVSTSVASGGAGSSVLEIAVSGAGVVSVTRAADLS